MGKNYRIAVLPGDGTGPEVVAEGLKVLAAAGKKCDFTIETTDFTVMAGRKGRVSASEASGKRP